MSKIFGDIKSQLQGVLKIKDVNSDNVVFKLFYKATFALLIASAGNFLNIFCSFAWTYLQTPLQLPEFSPWANGTDLNEQKYAILQSNWR